MTCCGCMIYHELVASISCLPRDLMQYYGSCTNLLPHAVQHASILFMIICKSRPFEALPSDSL